MAFVIFLLRTRTMLISKYGTAVLRFLILCCIIRILLPVEFPEHQYILADNFLYSWIVKHFKIVLHPDFKSLLLTFLIIVWICGIMPAWSSREPKRFWRRSSQIVHYRFVSVPGFPFPCWQDIFIRRFIFRSILIATRNFVMCCFTNMRIGRGKISGRS